MVGGGGIDLIRRRRRTAAASRSSRFAIVSVTCVNWPYRTGANPFRKQISATSSGPRGPNAVGHP